MDMDIGCFTSKDIGDIINYMEATGKTVALPQTEPLGLSNDVMLSSANSTFFKEAIGALPAESKWFGIHYLTVLYSTGSLFLSAVLQSEATRPLYTEKGMRYFRHLHVAWQGPMVS